MIEKLDLSILDSLDLPGSGIASNDVGGIKTVESIEQFSNFDDKVEVGEENDVEEVDDNFNDGDDSFEIQTDTLAVEESPVKVWAEFAAERGLIDLEENEEIGDSEEFLVEKFNKKVESVFNNYKESLPDSLKQLLNAYEKGIPLDNLLDIESRIMEYSSIDEEKLSENTDLQKNIIKEYLKFQDYTDDDIDNKIEKYEDNLLLESESKHAIKKLIKIEEREKENLVKEAEKAEQENMRVYNERVANFSKSIMEKEEIIPGISVTKEQKEAIIKMTTKPVAVLKNGMPVTALKKMEMEDPDFLSKLAYMALVNWDLSSIERKAATKEVRKIKEKINTYKDSGLSKLDIGTIKKAVKINQNRLFK